MKKIFFALVVLIIVAIGTYYFVFNKSSQNVPTYTPALNPTNQENTSNSDINTNVSKTILSTSTQPKSKSLNPVSKPSVPIESVGISIKDFAFNPGTLKITTGTKVIWTNDDIFPHTITSDSGNLLNSSTLSPGQKFSFTFTNIGKTSYHCSIHPMMKGEIVVTD